MEQKDRMKITANCNKLVKEINWPKILPKLLEHGIYQAENKIVEQWKDNMDNNRNIYLNITKRGPNAFNQFVQCLREIGRNDLADILKTENSADQVDNNFENDINPEINRNNDSEMNNETIENNGSDDDYYKRLQKVDTPLVVVVKKANKFTEKVVEGVPWYPMKTNPRGLVLIINNISFGGEQSERRAAKHDEDNLNVLFKQMGFSVQIYRDLKIQEMLDTIETFSKQPELRRVHSIFLIVMSHGNERVSDNQSRSVVCGIDNEYVTDTEIVEFFTATNCQDMFNKPKVFIFQTCRGVRFQHAVKASNVCMGRDDTDVNHIPPPAQTPSPAAIPRDISDMLFAYSTLPGYESYRDMKTGSWYIQTLCEVIMNHAHNKEFTTMLKMVDQRLSNMQTSNHKCQTSSHTSWGFNKQFYLNPGYFEDKTDT